MNRRALKIKKMLKKAKKTQTDIAKDLGISGAAVSKYINGTSTSHRFDEWLEGNLGLSA